MAFIIETGQGIANATSYVSVEEADAYFERYGIEEWDGEDEDKELALIKASRAIDLLYGQRFLSYPSFPDTQGLLFPRATFYINQRQTISSTSVPRLLKEAVCEVALMSLNDEDIIPDVAEGSAIAKESVKIGELAFSYEYNGETTNTQLEGFRKIELILGPLLVNDGQPGNFYAYMSL